jgi:hypothetical protein
MKVHVIRSASFAKKDYSQVIKLLKSKSSPVEFIDGSKNDHSRVWAYEKELITALENELTQTHEAQVLEGTDICTEWGFFFNLCDIYREENQIPDNDFVVLLTPHYNFQNWFTSFSDNSNNIFAHTKEWEYYLSCSSIYPITYLVMSQVIQKTIFKTIEEKYIRAHQKARGCMNDFCTDKADISLKLRTADICPECLHELSQNGEYDNLISQAFALFEKIRKDMLYKQHHKPKPSRLHITRGNEIILTDYQNLRLNLTPLEKTVFFLFLKHKEGIKLLDRENYRSEVKEIYRQLNIFIPSATTEEKTVELEYTYERELLKSVISLTDVDEDSLSEKFSNIRKKLKNTLPAEVFDYYDIIGARSEPYKIHLDRTLVTCDSGILGPEYSFELPSQKESTLAEN